MILRLMYTFCGGESCRLAAAGRQYTLVWESAGGLLGLFRRPRLNTRFGRTAFLMEYAGLCWPRGEAFPQRAYRVRELSQRQRHVLPCHAQHRLIAHRCLLTP